MQIMPGVFILGCVYALTAYRELMRAKSPKPKHCYKYTKELINAA